MADSKVHSVLNAGAVLVTITALSMAARIITRWLHKTMGIDDILIFTSWILSIGICCSAMLATRYGLGVDRSEVSDDDYNTYSQLLIACSISYSWGVPAAKASFAVLYMRIFPEGGFRMVNKFMIVFLFAQSIEETSVVLLRYDPVRKSWDFRLEGSCLDLHPLWYTTVSYSNPTRCDKILRNMSLPRIWFILNLITDLTLFIEPIPSTWKLQIPLVKRLGLICMLSLGLLVTVISVVRIVYVINIGDNDTYEIAEPLIWAMTEMCALIICSCIPSLRQVAAFIPGLNNALGLSSGADSYGHSENRNHSIPLKPRNRKEYIQSQKSKASSQNRSGGFGMTSLVTAVGMDVISENGSQDEIFPHKSDQTGAIMITTEVQHRVEDGKENTKEYNKTLMPHHGELRNITESPDRTSSPAKISSDMGWLRRPKI
ncbi:uncharacterized protein F4812DRAFT_414095 [Daldinia caldariorum]|uniref:uncharacterized protein n=1 Tax=Daldinia caldariorum TaxID=326644 RepID=UPI0020079640|nr:uncharacterized protein F4812DRAFT_414095 [Daldinia caldariorum]KAI1471449.1 hypothetical protein F4812DRAFT_414095 [Daldinia caldariorum]